MAHLAPAVSLVKLPSGGRLPRQVAAGDSAAAVPRRFRQQAVAPPADMCEAEVPALLVGGRRRGTCSHVLLWNSWRPSRRASGSGCSRRRYRTAPRRRPAGARRTWAGRRGTCSANTPTGWCAYVHTSRM